jgi:hypothetical protein
MHTTDRNESRMQLPVTLPVVMALVSDDLLDIGHDGSVVGLC